MSEIVPHLIKLEAYLSSVYLTCCDVINHKNHSWHKAKKKILSDIKDNKIVFESNFEDETRLFQWNSITVGIHIKECMCNGLKNHWLIF